MCVRPARCLSAAPDGHRCLATAPGDLTIPRRLPLSACERVGLTPRSVRLLRHFANAVFLVDAETPVVARVAYKAGSVERARTAVDITHRLAGEGFPATQPIHFPDHEQPVAFADGSTEAAVSFWAYFPQPSSTITPAAHLLGVLGRQLQRLVVCPENEATPSNAASGDAGAFECRRN